MRLNHRLRLTLSCVAFVGCVILALGLTPGAPAVALAAAPNARGPLGERLARAEASVHALDHRLTDIAARGGGKAGNAKLVERARKLGRRRGKGALAWNEYLRRVPGVVEVPVYASDAALREADKAAAELGDDLDAIWARRKQVQAERMVLWSKIAFRSIADRELPNQPLYRFELKVQAGKTSDEQRMEALRAVVQFVRVVDHLSGQAQEGVDADPAAIFVQWHKLLAEARARLQDKLLSQADLAMEVYKLGTDAGKLSAAAKNLAELAQTIVDAEKALSAAEKAEDDEEADASRAQLQQALADTAIAVTALDAAVGRAASSWGISFAPGTKAALGELPDIAAVGSTSQPVVSDRVRQAAAGALEVIRVMGLSQLQGGYPRFMRSADATHRSFNDAISSIKTDVEAIQRGEGTAIVQFHSHIQAAQRGLDQILAGATGPRGPAVQVPDLKARFTAIDEAMTAAEKGTP